MGSLGPLRVVKTFSRALLAPVLESKYFSYKVIQSFDSSFLALLAMKVFLESKSELSDILKALLSCKRCSESPCLGTASAFLCCIWHSFPSS